MFDVCPQYCQVLAEYLPSESKGLSRIPMHHYFAALEAGAKLNQDPLWGFELGKQINSAQYGLLGYLVESSAMLQQALDALLAFDKTVADIGICQFATHQGVASIAWQPYENNQHAILRNMTAWVAMVRHITGQPLSAHHVEFNLELTQSQNARLSNWYGCEVRDNATRNVIYFDAELLDMPILTRNELVNANLYPAIRDLQRAYEHNQSWFAKLQPSLHRCDLQDMSLTRLAQLLDTSPRTLQRQLKCYSVSFSQLLEQERKRRFTQFCQVLSKQALSELLGYAEQASLNRAVKRWYGVSPSEYVRQQQKTQGH
ncbi:helix-turn-helix domain-containing protein [Pseudoalteromonas sp. JBTF-M23]|uniref:Helix-turn-helix domain-containing protein n=1 Tax=Pseudoalteromonas caenipelagi TaxID=2726988 RepID=A0A849VLD0_9GAMM|nr:AraC family transcriptional regulator ligand-binding domain-containing protein [Pseudoalteromonas caenipelagi]NOU52407.1 helix-turn-helix domain-containing protein [Pseudoalteromonas caenipelagi]